MAQRVKTLDTKPDDLNLIPGTHMAEGETHLELHLCPVGLICAYRHMRLNKRNLKAKLVNTGWGGGSVHKLSPC